MIKEQWNQRYSDNDYTFGKEPNQFLNETLPQMEPGRMFFPGDGEGRNSVFAAKLGWNVDAIDFSEEGKKKADRLADESGVNINYRVEDFNSFDPDANIYDAAGIFFIHLSVEMRLNLFGKIINALKPGGKFIFECFEKEQLNYTSGGPKDSDLLYSLEEVVGLFIDLEFEKLTKEKVMLNEGPGHSGEGMVIRFIGIKPK